MAMRVLLLIMLLAVIASLFSGLFFLLKDGGRGDRAVRALTIRIVLSLVLFALLMIGFHSGLLASH